MIVITSQGYDSEKKIGKKGKKKQSLGSYNRLGKQKNDDDNMKIKTSDLLQAPTIPSIE